MNVSALNPELRAAWVEALKSGEYAQCEGTARTIQENGACAYCCLGVLQDVMVKRDDLTEDEAWGNDPATLSELAWDVLGARPCDPFEVRVLTVTRDGEERSAWMLNDLDHLTLPEIGALIEKNS